MIDLIERALDADEPLNVVAIGAITNLASALRLSPEIVVPILATAP